MRDYLDAPAESIAVVPHGVDTTAFPVTPPDLTARRRARGGRLVVGFLARACPEMGLEQLVRELPLLLGRQGGPPRDVEVLAAGAEVDSEKSYLANCLALAAELGVSDRFRWLGQVDFAGKLRLLDSIDVFAMPTVFPEAKGLPVIEAMAAGVPVVAPAHGTFPELLDDERAGLLHAVADPADLARRIGTLLDDQDLAARCGRHGHDLSRARHTADLMAAAHEELYARLL
jgi:glycosyltransferase involved in cell wall biosynthesis